MSGIFETLLVRLDGWLVGWQAGRLTGCSGRLVFQAKSVCIYVGRNTCCTALSFATEVLSFSLSFPAKAEEEDGIEKKLNMRRCCYIFGWEQGFRTIERNNFFLLSFLRLPNNR